MNARLTTLKLAAISTTLTLNLLCFSGGVSAAVVPTDLRTNTSSASAFNIDNYFSTEYVANIETAAGPNLLTPDTTDVIYTNESDRIPHATINVLTKRSATQFISFTVTSAGTRGIFDIDDAERNELDSYISLLDSDGSTVLAFNDDALDELGLQTPSGSGEFFTRTTNSYLEYTFDIAGVYFLEIGAYYKNSGNAGNHPDPWLKIDDNISLITHVSLDSSASVVPAPASVWLLSSGLLGLAGVSRRTPRT